MVKREVHFDDIKRAITKARELVKQDETNCIDLNSFLRIIERDESPAILFFDMYCIGYMQGLEAQKA